MQSAGTSYFVGIAGDPKAIEDYVLYTTTDAPKKWMSSTPTFTASTGIFSGFAEKSTAVKVILPTSVSVGGDKFTI